MIPAVSVKDKWKGLLRFERCKKDVLEVVP